MDLSLRYQVNFWAGKGLTLRHITEVVEARSPFEAIGLAVVRLREIDPKIEVRVDGITVQEHHETRSRIS